MKKYYWLFALASTLATAADAQKKINVPEAVSKSFAKEFPGATPKWEKENNKFEANFKQQQHTMSALFTADGKLTETEVDIPVAELPAPVQAFVKEKHKGAAIKEAARITKANGEINYEAEVHGKDLLFDKEGKFIQAASY